METRDIPSRSEIPEHLALDLSVDPFLPKPFLITTFALGYLDDS